MDVPSQDTWQTMELWSCPDVFASRGRMKRWRLRPPAAVVDGSVFPVGRRGNAGLATGAWRSPGGRGTAFL